MRNVARKPAPASNWRRIQAPRRALAERLQSRHRLRVHGWCIGSFTLALMWATSHLQMLWGVDSLALRYLSTLGVGYVAYLLVLRAWAAWLVWPHRRGEGVDPGLDLVPEWPGTQPAGRGPPEPGGGGDFAGAGASGDFDGPLAQAGESMGDGFGTAAGHALEAAAGADEGAVVVVPVVAIFLIGLAIAFGAGALAWLYFGWEVLLTVAVELAFSVATARAAMGAERAGWLGAAVRLTWKPLLGALLCAVALGAALDHFMPHAQSLPQALRMLRAH
ncbi:hypothetical protein [Acidovorax sp. FG27]|uniref:hypothetical protein n=1 Tax=Acidovorax sp. FG27 TaxID=3133652 RepID=UPI0030E924B0